MRSLRTDERGWTLVEAMVVLVIMGILLAVAVPQMAASNRRRETEAAALEMSARVQFARHRALATRLPHRLVMDADDRSYRTEAQQDDSTWVGLPDETYQFPASVGWSAVAGGSAGNHEVEFEPRGTILAEDAPLVVTFFGVRGDTFTLSLVRTGRVTVRPGAP